AAEPGLAVAAVEETLDELAATTGAGSTARRAALLGDLFGAATADEQAFLRRLLTGELRQGALEGVMLQAIAAAAEVPPEVVRRDGNAVRVWTRTLREITVSVPELVELVRSLPCRSVVLDGETLALRDDGRPRPFQETMSRFGAAAGELLLRPFFFDCLHLDG